MVKTKIRPIGKTFFDEPDIAIFSLIEEVRVVLKKIKESEERTSQESNVASNLAKVERSREETRLELFCVVFSFYIQDVHEIILYNQHGGNSSYETESKMWNKLLSYGTSFPRK